MVAKDSSSFAAPVVSPEDRLAERADFDGTLLAALAYGQFLEFSCLKVAIDDSLVVLERCLLNALCSINSGAIEQTETRADVLENRDLLARLVSASHTGHSWDVQVRRTHVY
jgi:hypothetical protein